MYQPEGDPFFEQLKLDIQDGIGEADRGELIDEAEIWVHSTLRSMRSNVANTSNAEAALFPESACRLGSARPARRAR